jgi:glycosyltransferase involved in cell wall biosynthesis
VIFVAWFILAVAGLNFLVSLVNLISMHYLPGQSIDQKPLVSVLIPARNEERNIGNILSDLAGLSYGNLEIIVFDDESTDTTKQIIQAFQRTDSCLSLLTGKPLPAGYTGKNHACHQLALNARGAYFLFLDADVRVKGALLEQALFWMEKKNLALLSIFPVQLMQTFGEKISVPLMNWILLSLLPMSLLRKSRRPSLAAANGQFMLFPAEIYKKFQFHRRFRGERVEDVAIIRFLKKKEEPVETFLGKDNISCRMYLSLGEAIQGFSKNIFLFFGNSIAATILYALLITTAPVWVVLYLPPVGWIVYVISILSMRINISVASRQPLFQNLIYFIPQQIIFLAIIVNAIYNRMNRKLIWKGRNVLNI